MQVEIARLRALLEPAFPTLTKQSQCIRLQLRSDLVVAHAHAESEAKAEAPECLANVHL
jgi:hypothetical protein